MLEGTFSDERGDYPAVTYLRNPAGPAFQPHGHPGGEEIVVLDGVSQDDQNTYPAGSWLRVHPVVPIGSGASRVAPSG